MSQVTTLVSTGGFNAQASLIPELETTNFQGLQTFGVEEDAMYMLIIYQFFWKTSGASLFGSGFFVFVPLILVHSIAYLSVFRMI